MFKQPHMDQFLIWLSGGHTKATVQSYYWALHNLRKYLDIIQKDITECTLNDLTAYIQHLENKGLKSGTRNHYVTSVRAIWHWLYKQDMVDFDKEMIPLPDRVDTESYDYLTQEEYEQMLNALSEHFPKELRGKAIIAFLFNTGVRLGELLSIKMSDIDLEKMKGRVKTYKRKNHWRDIYWNEFTNNLLKKWIEVRDRIIEKLGNSEYLFISLENNRGEQLAHSTIQRMIRNLRHQLNIKRKITVHSFRHGFGHRGVETRVNPRYLQVMMGHANLRSTQIYMGYDTKDVEMEYRNIFSKSPAAFITR